MKGFVIGAAGGIGRRLATLLTAHGHAVTGMHRKPEQHETVAATGAVALPGDLIADSVVGLADRLIGHDAVVFSAGAHGTGMDQTTLIDGAGLSRKPQRRPPPLACAGSCWSRHSRRPGVDAPNAVSASSTTMRSEEDRRRPPDPGNLTWTG